MTLSPGSHLGPYEVLALVGAGGMGEVYRARDPRLGREVAIKVLPHDRVADESRRQRFIQEAKAASALNHPHIVTIHEIESADGIDFLVMEYVRGKSLDALIPRQGMRLNEALRIAIAVADAVAAAHARGIIDRDLKPANVMGGTDGSVKVLDFGLAKLLSGDAAPDEETVTHMADAGLSAPGTIVGTSAYMSPEQATGAAVDARSDIFSFGAMLYEMVTGPRAFPGTSTVDTLAAVVRAQPKRPSEVTPGVPPDLEKVILRCLRKEPERRFQHSADLKVALQEVKEESDSGGVAPTPFAHRRRGVMAALVGLGLLTAVAAGWVLWPPAHKDAPQKLVSLTSMTGHALYPTFSPDGQQVAFAWQPEGRDNFDIYVKLVGLEDVRRLTSDPANDGHPSWSPDGRQIAFLRQGSKSNTIHVVSPIGGGERKLTDFRVDWEPIAWSPDGRYLAAGHDEPPGGAVSERGIYLMPTNGGEPRLITPPGMVAHTPAFSPDGRRLAYVSCSGTVGCPINLLDLDAGFTPTEPPRPLTPSPPSFTVGITWSRDGTSVIYSSSDGLHRIRLDDVRHPERIEVAGDAASWPAIASSRDRLAFSHDLNASIPYRFEPGRPSRPLLTSTLFEGNLVFSPDDQRIAYCANRSGEGIQIWTAGADGSTPQQLTHGPGAWQCSPHWSPDGQQIAFDSLGSDGHWHIWSIAADGGVPRQVTSDEGSQNVPSWSRDGQWIYYSGDQQSGPDVWRIHVGDGRKQRLTYDNTGRTLGSRESADGKSLIYRTGEALRAVPLAGGPSRELVPCAAGWTTASSGLYYAACGAESEWGGSNPALHLVNLMTGEDRVLGALERFSSASIFGLAVSPNGKVIVYDRLLREGHDLMLIENFR